MSGFLGAFAYVSCLVPSLEGGRMLLQVARLQVMCFTKTQRVLYNEDPEVYTLTRAILRIRGATLLEMV